MIKKFNYLNSTQLAHYEFKKCTNTISIHAFVLISDNWNGIKDQRTIGPENAHLKPDPAVLSHHEMTLTLNTHTPLLNS